MRNRRFAQGCIKELNHFLEEWRAFQDLVKLARSSAAVTADNEKKFLEVKTYLARRYTPLIKKIQGEEVQPHQVQPMNVINQVVTLEHAKGMSEVQIRKFEMDWHAVYIHLNQLLGQLESHQDYFWRGGNSNVFWVRHQKKMNVLFYLVLLALLVLVGVYFVLKMGFLSDIDFKALIQMLKSKFFPASSE